MKQYLMLLRGGESRFKKLNKKQTEEHMARWGQYMGGLGENLVGGLPLDSKGKVVIKGGKEVRNKPYGAGAPVNGYLMVKAKDYKQAVKLAKDCPTFENGGTVEIRELMPM